MEIFDEKGAQAELDRAEEALKQINVIDKLVYAERYEAQCRGDVEAEQIAQAKYDNNMMEYARVTVAIHDARNNLAKLRNQSQSVD